MVRQRALWAVALTLAAVATPRDVRARSVTAATRLDYDASPGCPTGDGFRAIVVTRLGYDPFRAEASDLVVVRVEPTGRTLEGRLEWRDEGGAVIGGQTFPSRTGDCAELARAMGFALALQLQLMAATMGEPRPTAPPPATEPPPATAPAAPATPAPAAPVESAITSAPSVPSPRGPSFLAGAGLLAGLGVSSTPVAVGRLFATAAWSRLAVELAAEVSTPSTTNRADGAGFSQEEFLASLAGCGVSSPFSLCAVGKVGELRVTGQGVDVPLTASGLVVQSGLRLMASHGLGDRLTIMAHAEGLVRLTPGTVTLDSMPVWTTPRVAALLGLDLAVRFR